MLKWQNVLWDLVILLGQRALLKILALMVVDTATDTNIASYLTASNWLRI